MYSIFHSRILEMNLTGRQKILFRFELKLVDLFGNNLYFLSLDIIIASLFCLPFLSNHFFWLPHHQFYSS